MKCYLILISLIILSLIEFILNSRSKSRSKSKSKSRGKNKEKGKILNTKKNGPLSWDLLSEDDALETLLKSERQEDNNKSNFLNDSQNKINRYPFTSSQQDNNPNFISKNEINSENLKSKTFKSVGPYDDSTINNSGVKYSKIYHNKSNKNLKPGFYGSSRLTRF